MKNMLNFINKKILKNKKLLLVFATFAFLFLCLPVNAYAHDPNSPGLAFGLGIICGLSSFSSVVMIILSSIAIYFKTPRFLYVLSFLNGLLFFFFGYFNFEDFRRSFEVASMLTIIFILITLSFAVLAYIDFRYAHNLIPFKIIYWIIPAVIIIIPFSPVIYVTFVDPHIHNIRASKQIAFQNELDTAIKNRDLEKFKEVYFVRKNVSIKEYLRKANKEDIEFFISAGVDFKKIPISEAIEQGNLDILKFLIEQGFDVNAKNNRKQTPLHYAVLDEREKIVELLISKGAYVNAKDKDGKTPLHYAIEYSNKEIVELLISKGADINAKDKRDNTPLDYTQGYLYPEEIKQMLIFHGAKNGKDLAKTLVDSNKQNISKKKDNPDKDLEVSLRKDIADGNKDEVEKCLKEIKFAKGHISKDINPLYLAAIHNHLEIAKILLEYGVDANDGIIGKKTIYGERGQVDFVETLFISALDGAIKKGYKEMVKLLLANGAKASRESLYNLVNKGEKEILQLLLEKGVDAVNIIGYEGDGARIQYNFLLQDLLEEAIDKGKKEIVQLLLKNGAKRSKYF